MTKKFKPGDVVLYLGDSYCKIVETDKLYMKDMYLIKPFPAGQDFFAAEWSLALAEYDPNELLKELL